MSENLYFKYPKLRKNVKIIENEEFITINYHGNSLDIGPSDTINIFDIKNFINLLNGKNSVEDISSKSNCFTKEQVINYIDILDDYLLLEEGKEFQFKGKSGLNFILELEDYYSSWQNFSNETNLTKKILDKKASKNLLVGFAFEYYHVTRRCHECLTPAIAKSHGETRLKVFDFFIEEYRHDKLLIKSLTSLGFERSEIEDSMPLPYTQAIMNMLSKWAHTDILSFMAGIFIFEGSDYDGLAYKDALKEYSDLPEDFAKYQNTHGDINIEGDHGHVTRDFFMDIDYISEEDQRRVIKNIRILNELHLRMHQNTIDYYDKEIVEIPRSLDKLVKIS
ncbi:iron-containing redox enzyme family protein [Priestia flexa]|uniref:iron-containing redox enzyme family protein n=1 Tax=Priestia flexa TaxID=86664 RepID=UPI00077CD653|nr:iron-containing redox enzyme family protein [Priestia flexa]MED4590508.1 iron-containing redox enzyme family protein [Priestia flexa]